MDNQSSMLPSISRLWERKQWLSIIRVAIEARSLRFARQVAMAWLNIYPGDLTMSYWLAKSFVLDGLIEQGQVILERVLQVDPEFYEGYRLVLDIAERGNAHMDPQAAKTALFVLNPDFEPLESMPEWAERLRQARQALEQGHLEQAENQIYRALTLAQDQLLVYLTHIRILHRLQDWVSVVRFSNLYRQRWPDCLGLTLALAEGKLALGDEAEGTSLLHRCVTMDVAGQVILRWLGPGHPFWRLWPDSLTLTFDFPVPAEVAAHLGWNQLSEPSVQEISVGDVAVENLRSFATNSPEYKDSERTVNEEQSGEEPKNANESSSVSHLPRAKSPWVLEIENELDAIAKRINRGGIAHVDGRFPIYVVFSSRVGLEQHYGEQAATTIVAQMQELVEVVANEFGWGAMIFLPDDADSMARLGMKPLEKTDAWSLKLALVDLDEVLAKRGGRIGALLIIGGDEIVPFHRLPNPTDDIDTEVLSDNPYATRDSNYFVPEWAVGRLPGGRDRDPGPILQSLRSMQRYHRERRRNPSWWERWLAFWRSWGFPEHRGLGYSAAVWRRAALATFRPVGRRKIFWISPPYKRERLNPKVLTRTALNYYNLHGLIDGAEWYGQKDPHDPTPGPDYPVALTPGDLVKNGKAPRIVFSEACYGGHILGKSDQDSIALRFLDIGTLAFVGSTSISYGAVQSPLVGADLLGYYFWNGLRAGYSAGEALLLAKIALVREMNRRQGFLDGEDQKTLISFTLYGDPLTYGLDLLKPSKRLFRSFQRPRVKTIADQPNGKALPETMSGHLVAEAKKILEPFLPGLAQAEWRLNVARSTAGEREANPVSGKSALGNSNEPLVLVFHRNQIEGGKAHPYFARVTMSKEGKVMKVSISR
ncbi:C25 family cysteine peptidase [uncultured Thermanaerothrix sp.]|uniref:C25 family cysteine peptidase n=1 Tax=uncultured Thermanaerothrix sp. TaxID=1195149 RepID=UPI00261B19EE|nr:C25 family cysteine peptidase [uncultured Thermanaerothrix sp.]